MPSFGPLGLGVSIAVLASIDFVNAFPIPYNDLTGRVAVQAHRGGLGLRSEESLWAFAYAMEIGADVLEMDTVFTSDGIPVIWHDHNILASKCTGPYVGQYIANLTLAQVKELDCSVPLLPTHPQQEIHSPTRIATLEEVLDLIDCYGDKGFTINLETKLDPLHPNETLSVDTYVNDLVPILADHDFLYRTTIQSFDWRTLIGIRDAFPDTHPPLVALVDDTTVVPDDSGAYPWLGGLNLADYNDDWVAAAAALGASIVSPVHGVRSNETVNTPGYEPFVTKELVQHAHKLGLQVVPWTVDYEVTISKLIDDGVDAIISDYPERVLAVAHQRGLSSGRGRLASKPECLANA